MLQVENYYAFNVSHGQRENQWTDEDAKLRFGSVQDLRSLPKRLNRSDF